MLLVLSNIFMTLAWYGHLRVKELSLAKNWGLFALILFSWGLAFFEYCLQVPANRLGSSELGGPFSLVQLKIIQEAITLVVFIVFSMLLFRHEPMRWNHYLAVALVFVAVWLAMKK
ncbi:MAG: DMT family protein [Flavobacteriales bacterium]